MLRIFWVLCLTLPTLIPSWAGHSTELGRPFYHPPSDSTKAVTTIVNFLNWYRTHYKEINEKGLSYADKNGWYKVDTLSCREYLNKLMKSNFFTPNYKKLWQDYFVSKAGYWESSPQNEGPPEGFDYDLVLLTQEPELFYNKPESLAFKVIEQSQDFIVIGVTADWTLYFEMTQHKGKWIIDYISAEGFD